MTGTTVPGLLDKKRWKKDSTYVPSLFNNIWNRLPPLLSNESDTEEVETIVTLHTVSIYHSTVYICSLPAKNTTALYKEKEGKESLLSASLNKLIKTFLFVGSKTR
jgi:hypothetical protein